MDPKADLAFQDLKRYLTSPPVMVVPHPLEPLVLYVAATPHSASAALVAVREERQAKGLPRNAAPSAGTVRHQDGAAEATTTSVDDQAPQAEDAPEAAVATTGDQAPKVPRPQEASQPPEASDSASTPALVEHPVYFVSTMLRDVRAHYPMPQKLLLALLVA
nr:testis-specific gene A8 protein-like [Aegilops tauschii subsp. strangulata]